MAAFLAINGIRLQAEQMDTYHFMMDLYSSGQFRMPVLEAWLREHAEADSR